MAPSRGDRPRSNGAEVSSFASYGEASAGRVSTELAGTDEPGAGATRSTKRIVIGSTGRFDTLFQPIARPTTNAPTYAAGTARASAPTSIQWRRFIASPAPCVHT